MALRKISVFQWLKAVEHTGEPVPEEASEALEAKVTRFESLPLEKFWEETGMSALECCTLPELRDFLREKGEPVSGKKSQLVSRVDEVLKNERKKRQIGQTANKENQPENESEGTAKRARTEDTAAEVAMSAAASMATTGSTSTALAATTAATTTATTPTTSTAPAPELSSFSSAAVAPPQPTKVATQVYTMKMILQNCTCTFKVPANMTFDDAFNGMLANPAGFNFDDTGHLYDAPMPNGITIVSPFDQGGGSRKNGTMKLSALGLKPGHVIPIHFDYGADWRFTLQVEGLESEFVDGGQELKVKFVNKKGKSPPQYSYSD